MYKLKPFGLFIIHHKKKPDSFLIIEEEPTSIKGKLLSILKGEKIEKKKMYFNEIDMKFIVDDNIYYYLISDKENNGYRINSILED